MDGQNNEEKKPRRRVKKVKGHAAHHGGAWKVAYADFITAMMALFLVLWLVSQADIKVKQAIANYFRAPGVFDTLQGGILPQAKKVSQEPDSLTSKDDEQMLFNTAQKLQERFSSRPDFAKYKEQVKIEVTDEGLRIQLIDKADRISFPSGSAKLAVEAEMILAEIAKGICELPNKINVGGHTDSHVFGTNNQYTNWELSTDRANAARRVLESICVKPEQIHRIIGYADTLPMDASDPFAPSNRRISITVLRLAVAEQNAETPAADKPVSLNLGTFKPEKSADANKGASAAKTTASPAASPSEKTAENATETSVPAEDADEKKTTKAKLLNEGAVKIGEADAIPDVPKVKVDDKR